MKRAGMVKVTRRDIEVFNRVHFLSGKTCRYVETFKDGSYKVRTTNHLQHFLNYSVTKQEVDDILDIVGYLVSKGESKSCLPDNIFTVWKEFRKLFKDFY